MNPCLEGYLIGVCLLGIIGELKSPGENTSGKILLALLWPIGVVAIGVGTIIQVVALVRKGDNDEDRK